MRWLSRQPSDLGYDEDLCKTKGPSITFRISSIFARGLPNLKAKLERQKVAGGNKRIEDTILAGEHSCGVCGQKGGTMCRF